MRWPTVPGSRSRTASSWVRPSTRPGTERAHSSVSPLTGRTATALEALGRPARRHHALAAEAQGEAALIRELLVNRLRRGSGADRQRALWASGPRPAFVQAMANVTAGLDLASARRPARPWS